MTIMMLLPSFGQSFSGIAALAAENDQIIDTILYDGPDGFADVSATLAQDKSQIHWTVTLNKKSTEVASRQQLEVDISGSGLSAPHSLSSNATSEMVTNVMKLQENAFTNDATDTIFTFVTDVLDATQSEHTLKVAVATVTEETASTITIHTSPHTKILTFNIPKAIPEVIQESIPIEDEILEVEEEIELPEVVEPVQEEVKEAPVEEIEEVVEKAKEEVVVEIIEETTEELPPETPKETPTEKPTETPKETEELLPTTPTEKPTSTELPNKEEPLKELEVEKPVASEIEVEAEETFDPNVVEPVSKDYVSKSFSPTIGLLSKTSSLFQMKTTPSNHGSIELNKTA